MGKILEFVAIVSKQSQMRAIVVPKRMDSKTEKYDD